MRRGIHIGQIMLLIRNCRKDLSTSEVSSFTDFVVLIKRPLLDFQMSTEPLLLRSLHSAACTSLSSTHAIKLFVVFHCYMTLSLGHSFPLAHLQAHSASST